MSAPLLRRRPSQRPANASDEAYETIFIDWLVAQGYAILREPDAFEIPPRPGHRQPQRPTPDLRILALPGGIPLEEPLRLYLELTCADRYASQSDLPPEVQAKNRRQAKSGKAYISPAKKLRLKRERMHEVECHHPGVIILILDYGMQRSSMRFPASLTQMIDRRLDGYTARAAS